MEEDEGLNEATSTEIFSLYRCRSLENIIPDAVEHPGDIAEPASLAAISLPPTDYRLALPDAIIKDGLLSQLQLEGVIYTATKHCYWLPCGQRAGFFIGDGAGVGKGRQIAGIILDAFCRGLMKSAWISTSSDLYLDALRDIKDLGAYIPVHNNLQSLDKAIATPTEGCMFLTYSTLTSITRGRRRLDQLLQWLGGSSFSGVIVFDEAHKAKHYAAKESQGTKVAAAVIELQQALPAARIVYASATGVCEVSNMAYLSRLGLFGPGTAFKDFDTFANSLRRKGINFLEHLAMDLKSQGFYLARGLSFRSTEFTQLELKLTESQQDMYDTAVAGWIDLRQALHRALEINASNDPWRAFWAAQQRFFRSLCVSMKVPGLVKEVRSALKSGYAIIIGLQSTGEAAADALNLEPGCQCEFISVCREIMIQFVLNHFPNPAKKTSDYSGSYDGNYLSNEEITRQTKEIVEIKKNILDRISMIDLPPNFLDDLIDQLGGKSCVAEMTGRKARIVRDARGIPTYECRAKPDSDEMESLNIKEKDLFMGGMKNIAIISDAASTGISLHASVTANNQKRRMHFTIELPWSADKAIQQLGRTHRSNQSSAPFYRLVFTDLGGEKRFVSAVAKRLQSLGALTKGDRRAASGLDIGSFNFDTYLGRRALRLMCEQFAGCSAVLRPGLHLEDILEGVPESDAARFRPKPDSNGFISAAAYVDAIQELHMEMQHCIEIMDLGVTNARSMLDLDERNAKSNTKTSQRNLEANFHVNSNKSGNDGKDVRKFLNRLLGLPVCHQRIMFNYFQKSLDAEIALEKASGSYVEGVSDIPGERINRSGPPELLWTDPISNLKTFCNHLTVDRGVPFSKALNRLQLDSASDDLSSFYVSRRAIRGFGLHAVILALQTPGQNAKFTIIRPNTGEAFIPMDANELNAKYVRCTSEEAKEIWENSYEAAETLCTHGVGCQLGEDCQVGRRFVKITILTGSLIGIWDTLERTLALHENELSKVDKTMRIVRVDRIGIDNHNSTECGKFNSNSPARLIESKENSVASNLPLIGLRYPGKLLPAVVQQLNEDRRELIFGDALHSTGSMRHESVAPKIENPPPINFKALRKAFTSPKTVKDFFKPINFMDKSIANQKPVKRSRPNDTSMNMQSSVGLDAKGSHKFYNQTFTEEKTSFQISQPDEIRSPSEDRQISSLIDMGFSIHAARRALWIAKGNLESALEHLLTDFK